MGIPLSELITHHSFLIADSEVERLVRRCPDRYRNAIGKWKVHRSNACMNCGKCAEVCPYGVHARPNGYRDPVRPLDHRCIGEKCKETDHYCAAHCPVGALRVTLNPMYESLGDYRWTADLILSTWQMAETGTRPVGDLEYEAGGSGGGFDKLRFIFPERVPKTEPASVDTTIELNRRGDNRPSITIDVPWYGGGFIVLNGITFDHDGAIVELETPYPGSNLFSLASGGAIYVRDPHRTLSLDQLNGGEFAEMTEADWTVILPHLEENERLFGIPVERLLTLDGERRDPRAVYRKIAAARVAVEAHDDAEVQCD